MITPGAGVASTGAGRLGVEVGAEVGVKVGVEVGAEVGVKVGVEVGLGLGSNIGDKIAHLRRAVAELTESGLVRDVELSSFYRTPPWGIEAQDWFVNACAICRTDLPPRKLMALCQAVEGHMGRERTIRWGPRIIDVDILYYGDLVVDDPDLALPHAELLNRAFVLVPLAELRPDLRVRGTALEDALMRLDRTGIVQVSERSLTQL